MRYYGYNDSLPLSLCRRHRKYSDIGFNVGSGMSAVLDRIIQARRELSQCKIINVKTELSNLNAAIRLFDNGLLEKLTPLLNVTAKVLSNSYNKATDTVNSHSKTSMPMSIAYNNDATHIYNAYKLIETAADRSRYIIDPQKNLLPDIKEENKYSPVRIRRKANSKDSIPYGCRYNLFLSDAGVKGMKKGEHRMARDPEYVEALRGGGSTPPKKKWES